MGYFRWQGRECVASQREVFQVGSNVYDLGREGGEVAFREV
jgi:hypothetical protein